MQARLPTLAPHPDVCTPLRLNWPSSVRCWSKGSKQRASQPLHTSASSCVVTHCLGVCVCVCVCLCMCTGGRCQREKPPVIAALLNQSPLKRGGPIQTRLLHSHGWRIRWAPATCGMSAHLLPAQGKVQVACLHVGLRASWLWRV